MRKLYTFFILLIILTAALLYSCEVTDAASAPAGTSASDTSGTVAESTTAGLSADTDTTLPFDTTPGNIPEPAETGAETDSVYPSEYFGLTDTTLPRVYITTDGGADIDPYADYVTGTFALYSADGDNIAERPMVIRARGNTTKTYPKLSYRVKLDRKADVLGMGAARNWVLMANYADKSLIRNMSAFYLSSLMDNLEYTPSITPVHVFFNGRYDGVYTLGDQLQVQETRVRIEEGSEDADTGYFIECDVRAEESSNAYFEVSDMLFSIISPKPTNEAQYEFISDYFSQIDHLLRQQDDSVWELLDMASCVDWLIAKEICGGTGMGYDAYMYKDRGGKLYFGPVWDFDLAFGNADFDNSHRCDRYYVISLQWMYFWLLYPEFQQLFMERWEVAKNEYVPQMLDKIDEYVEVMSAAADDNFRRWDIMNEYVWPNSEPVMNAKTFAEQCEFVKLFVTEHVAWLDGEFDMYR